MTKEQLDEYIAEIDKKMNGFISGKEPINLKTR